MAYHLIDGALQERSFPGIDFSPKYVVATSLDGRWLAWSCEKSVCLMNPDARATSPTKLALPLTVAPSPDSNTAYYNPSMLWWSPDSQVLAVAYPGRDWQYRDALRLVVIDQNGVASFQDIVSGEEGGIGDLRWSPDSSQLLVVYLSGKTDLYNLQTGKLTPLPSPNGYPALAVAPAWSPTGKQIAFVAQDQRSLYIMNTDGTNITEIPPLPKDSEGAEALAPDYRIYQVFWVP
jgi:WD40 repeat protein